MSDMRIFVTGGSGFIGTAIMAHGLARGATMVNFDVMPPRDPAHATHWRRGDLMDAAGIAAAIREANPTHVIHMAARTDLLGRSLDDYAVNIAGVTNLLDALDAVPHARAVLASSMLVCRLGYQPKGPTDFQPSTVYGESKAVGERLTRARDPDGARLAMVRLTSIWGPWFAAPYRTFFEVVRRGLYVHPAGVPVQRSYGYVENIAAQIFALLDAPALSPAPYYLGDYEPTDILKWANQIAAASGRPPIRVAPRAVFAVAAKAGDVLQRLGWKNPPMTSFRLGNMTMSAVYDTAPIAALCPVLPVDRATGIARTVAWLDGVEGR